MRSATCSSVPVMSLLRSPRWASIRRQEFGVADDAAGLVCGGVLDERGEMRLHPLDQRLAADGAGGEVLRVRVERDGAGFTGRERHDEISMRFGDIAAVGHHLCLTNLEGG
jgi:hypothetical protein